VEAGERWSSWMVGEVCSDCVVLLWGERMAESSLVVIGVLRGELYVREGSIAVREASSMVNGESVIAVLGIGCSCKDLEDVGGSGVVLFRKEASLVVKRIMGP